MKDFTLRKVFWWPAFKLGLIIGAVLGIIPGLVTGFVARAAADGLRDLQAAALVDSSFLSAVPILQQIAGIGGRATTFALLLLANIALSALVCGLGALLGVLIYNGLAAVGGGLRLRGEVLTPVVTPVPAAMVAATAPIHPLPAGGPTVASSHPQGAGHEVIPPVEAQPPVQAPPPPPTPLGPRLESTQYKDVVLPLGPKLTRLGSTKDNDIVLPGAAERHAEIRLEGGRMVLYDLTGGQTWVQGRQVHDANLLKDGFTVKFGPQEMVYRAN